MYRLNKHLLHTRKTPYVIAFILSLCSFVIFWISWQEVEREISFRTECGLYYSYYKQMLSASSIQEGMEIYSVLKPAVQIA